MLYAVFQPLLGQSQVPLPELLWASHLDLLESLLVASSGPALAARQVNSSGRRPLNLQRLVFQRSNIQYQSPERFCGMLGGGNEFLKRLELLYPVDVIPDVFLRVYTKHVINDASDSHCSRDTKPGKNLWRQLQRAGGGPPTQWLTLPWSRVL